MPPPTRALLACSTLLICIACAGLTREIRPGETQAPAFRAPDQEGVVRRLSDYAGKWLVLYFYPRDATPGCTREACAFRDSWERFDEHNAVVVGVSTDSVESHRRFAEEHGLPFSLLADEDQTIARAYGVSVRMGFASRVTFLISPDGRIAHVFEDVDPGVHADEVIAKIDPGMCEASETP